MTPRTVSDSPARWESPYGCAIVDQPRRTRMRTVLRVKAFQTAERLKIPRAVRWPVERVVTILVARRQLRTATLRGQVNVYGEVRVQNHGSIVVDDHVEFLGGVLPTTLRCHHDATISIADRTQFNFGVHIEASHGITIGAGCRIAPRVVIVDKTPDRSGPVTIEDDVWLATGVTVLPGVRIGRGSAVAAGSVVADDVPPGCLAAGSPARSRPFAPATAQTQEAVP